MLVLLRCATLGDYFHYNWSDFLLVLHNTSFETDFDAVFVVRYLEFSKYYFGSDFKHLILDALLRCWCWFSAVLHYFTVVKHLDWLFFGTALFWCWFQALLDALLSCWCKYRPTRFFGASLKMGAVRQKQKHLFGRVVAFSIIHFLGGRDAFIIFGTGCIIRFAPWMMHCLFYLVVNARLQLEKRLD